MGDVMEKRISNGISPDIISISAQIKAHPGWCGAWKAHGTCSCGVAKAYDDLQHLDHRLKELTRDNLVLRNKLKAAKKGKRKKKG